MTPGTPRLPDHDRRRAPRIELKIPVTIGEGKNTREHRTENISLHGILISSAHVYGIGETHPATMALGTDHGTIPLHLQVAWSRASRVKGGLHHSGFAILKIGAEDAKRFESYLTERRKHLTAFLKEFPIFADFTDEDRRTLSGFCIRQMLGKGQTLFREGDLGRTLYIIREGMVRIVKKRGADMETLATASAGELFGEISLISGEAHNATIQAVNDSDLIGITGAAYDFLKVRDPALALKLTEVLMQFLVRRLRRTTTKLFSPGNL